MKLWTGDTQVEQQQGAVQLGSACFHGKRGRDRECRAVSPDKSAAGGPSNRHSEICEDPPIRAVAHDLGAVPFAGPDTALAVSYTHLTLPTNREV